MIIKLHPIAENALDRISKKLTTNPSKAEVVSLGLCLLEIITAETITPVINGRAIPLDLLITSARLNQGPSDDTNQMGMGLENPIHDPPSIS